MLKIEKHSDGQTTTIRVIGRMQAEHALVLQAVINESPPRIVLDLEELTLVDVEAVRFLGSCRRGGFALLHCLPYIRDWIAKEQLSAKWPAGTDVNSTADSSSSKVHTRSRLRQQNS